MYVNMADSPPVLQYDSADLNLKHSSRSSLVLLSLILISLLILILEASLHSTSESSLISFTSSFQSPSPSSSVRALFQAFEIMIPLTYPVYYIYCHNEIDPVAGMKMFLVTIGLYVGSNFFKIVYARPQTFWLSEELEGWNCRPRWSCPSEFSTVTLGSLIYLTFHIAHFKDMKNRTRELYGIIAGMIVLVLFVALVEIIQGFVSYFEILVSWAFGVMSVAGLLLFDRQVTRFIYTTLLNPMRRLGIWGIGLLIFICVSVLLNEFRDPEMKNSWEDRLNDACDYDLPDNVTRAVTKTSFVELCYCIAIFSAMLGMTGSHNIVKKDWWKTLNKKYAVVRFLLCLLYFYIGYALVWVVKGVRGSSSVSNLSDQMSDSSDFLRYILEDEQGYIAYIYGLVVNFPVGFIFTFIFPVIYDILKKKPSRRQEDQPTSPPADPLVDPEALIVPEDETSPPRASLLPSIIPINSVEDLNSINSKS
jgi:hypothetical protein